MKNNCDVSGLYAECKGEKTCVYVKKNQDCIYLSGHGTICNNLAAIRAAIEAERKCKEDCACFDGYIMQDCSECVRNDEHRDYYRTERIVDANIMMEVPHADN